VQDPADLPWDELDVDVALECTGVFRTREDASAHLDGGADTVIISAPPKGEEPVKQLVYGVNHDEYEGDDVISNASCTTNSITPVAKVLDAEFGIDAGTLTTVHAYTGSPEPDRRAEGEDPPRSRGRRRTSYRPRRAPRAPHRRFSRSFGEDRRDGDACSRPVRLDHRVRRQPR